MGYKTYLKQSWKQWQHSLKINGFLTVYLDGTMNRFNSGKGKSINKN